MLMRVTSITTTETIPLLPDIPPRLLDKPGSCWTKKQGMSQSEGDVAVTASQITPFS